MAYRLPPAGLPNKQGMEHFVNGRVIDTAEGKAPQCGKPVAAPKQGCELRPKFIWVGQAPAGTRASQPRAAGRVGDLRYKCVCEPAQAPPPVANPANDYTNGLPPAGAPPPPPPRCDGTSWNQPREGEMLVLEMKDFKDAAANSVNPGNAMVQCWTEARYDDIDELSGAGRDL